jgi:hypothetical protein
MAGNLIEINVVVQHRQIVGQGVIRDQTVVRFANCYAFFAKRSVQVSRTNGRFDGIERKHNHSGQDTLYAFIQRVLPNSLQYFLKHYSCNTNRHSTPKLRFQQGSLPCLDMLLV